MVINAAFSGMVDADILSIFCRYHADKLLFESTVPEVCDEDPIPGSQLPDPDHKHVPAAMPMSSLRQTRGTFLSMPSARLALRDLRARRALEGHAHRSAVRQIRRVNCSSAAANCSLPP
jgi:hypothetical protein